MSHEKNSHCSLVLDRHAVLALVTAEYMETGAPVTPTQAFALCNALEPDQAWELTPVLGSLVREGLLLMEGLGWVPCEGVLLAYQRAIEDEKKRLSCDQAQKDASTL